MSPLLLLALVPSALAGDLWLEVERTGAGAFQVSVPGTWLLTWSEPVPVTTGGRVVDLRDVAATLDRKRVGTRTTLAVDEPGTMPLRVSLQHRASSRHGPVLVHGFVLDARGPDGGSLHIDVPVEDGSRILLHRVAGGYDALLRCDALTLPWHDPAFYNQLVRAAPQVLLSIQGDDGTRVRLASE